MADNSKFNKRTMENIHKMYFLVREYPQKKITDMNKETQEDNGIAGLFQTSPIDFNIAAWGAVELGLIGINDDKSVEFKPLPVGFEWEFGELVNHLMEMIPYAIGKVNEGEDDVEENYLANWTAGFPAHDVMIAMRRLIELEVLSTYDVSTQSEVKANRAQKRKGAKDEVIVDTYTFFTLAANADKRWGEKQFANKEKLQSQGK